MKFVIRRSSLVTVAALAATAASAATADFTATTVRNWNGREGVTFVRYVSKDSSKVYGSAFVFDLSKGYRLKAWLGTSNQPNCAPAAVGAMAEAMLTSEGVLPIAGINGDYFDTSTSYARPTGMVISDSDLVSTGFARVSLTANCYLAETGDHNLFHGKLDCVEGLAYGGQPSASWQLNACGHKVRNAIRTNYCNYPVKGGAINPVGSSSGESAFPTTIGNMQSRDYYYRTLVGIGTNAVGVATNLVLWSNTIYNGVLGIGDSPFSDVDAYQIMIDLGCNEVGELDGGGSATIWSENCTTLQNFFKGGTTAHGGYVNAYRDSNPRAVACGIFVMPPPATSDAVALNGSDTYPDMAEAMRAAVPGDSLTILGAKPRHGAIVEGSGGDRIAIEWEPEIFEGDVVNVPWFSADAASGTVKGGAWVGSGTSSPSEPLVSQNRYTISRSGGEAVFSANTSREGLARLSVMLHQHGGIPEDDLPDLLAEAIANGDRAALVSVQGSDGSTSLRGLAFVNDSPAWVPLGGATSSLPADTDIAVAIDLDLTADAPKVSYLVGGSGASPVLSRLHSPSGHEWLPAAGFATGSPVLAGGVAIGGLAEVAAFAGTTAIPGRAPSWRDKPVAEGRGEYAVAVLGDTHFDTAPDTVYHAAYDTSTSIGASGIKEYRRSAEMWQDRMPRLLAASSALATNTPGSAPATTGAGLSTRFILQLGDIINGDCNDDAVHLQYLKDALAATRAPYTTAVGAEGGVSRPLPFLTVLGNHDFRGSPNGRKIYFEWAEPLLSRELGENVAYPLFSFRIDDDRWIFCDFERVSLFDVAAEIEADQEARYVFLVTHGPFTPNQSGNNWIWRLSAWKAKGGTGKGVPELFEAISRRRAIVLSGHTHYTSFYRNENQFGGYTEFTANSVWKSDDLAHVNPFPGHDNPMAFGTYRSGEVSAANRDAYDADFALFKPGLKEYFLGPCAGHFRLEVTDDRVLMRFYPGDASESGRTFDLTPGQPHSHSTTYMVK